MNQAEFRIISKCRLCESTNLREALGLRPTPLGDRYLKPGLGAKEANLVPLEVIQCHDCGNFQTSAVIDATGIYESYLSRPGAVNSKLSISYQEYAQNLTELTGLDASDLVVELGSNDGLFASFFAENGFRCIGVDPAKNLAATSIDRGVHTITDYFSLALSKKIMNEFGQAKIIVANFMIANIDELRNFMIGVKNLLAQNGIFAMETNYVSEVISNLLIETLNHEHLSYFSVSSLSRFFDSLDLELFEVKRVPSKNGSLRCFVKHRGAKFPLTSSVAEAKRFETVRGLFLDTAWNQFAEVIKHARNSANAYCSDRTGAGVVGYGTSIGATTLLYQLEIGNYISGLIDDDPYRQGLESPGFAVPTISADSVFTSPPKARNCIVLAPQYVSQIVSKNSAAIALGVKFARVWPIVEEVTEKKWWSV